MSDNWIALIPLDPLHVPEPTRQRRARKRFMEIVPNADAIDIIVADRVKFFDCGTNFECVRCPECGLDVPMEWWQKCMDTDNVDGFKLNAYTLPCCGKSATLNDFDYVWNQGFAQFALEAMNPGIRLLSDSYKLELESILGTKLRVIYQHL